MYRRSPSSGSLVGDGTPLGELGRLPPRSPLAAMVGQRTPPTCPASPLVSASNAWAPSAAAAAPPPITPGFRSTGSTPARPRASNLSCNALPPIDLGQSHVLSSIVTAALESNITAEQCFSTYGRMHAAPPLVGMSHNPTTGHAHPAAGAAASAAGIMQSVRPPAAVTAGATPVHGSHLTSGLLNDINDVDFGLATCLATPMDPGPGLQRRLVQLPATTTAAARSAAYKLTSANDILQETSRYGDWVRRQSRRRKLERMQNLLAELGANAILGRLVDDTLLDIDALARRRKGGWWKGDHAAADSSSGGNRGGAMEEMASRSLRCDFAGSGPESGSARILSGSGRRDDDEFPAQFEEFRDDMAL